MPKIATTKEQIVLLCNIKWEKEKQGEDFRRELDEAWEVSEIEAIKVVRSWGCVSIKEIKEALNDLYNNNGWNT